MKRRMLCIALSLCLLCSVLFTPAMANHACTDADLDGRCDTCDEFVPHFCCSCDGDAYCDICEEMMKHTCMFVDGYAICGKCFEPAEHDCVDADEDLLCDLCVEVMAHDCIDEDEDFWCDICSEVLEHDCVDEDGDFWCDICDEQLEHDCFDDDGDSCCDLCGYPLSHECVDTDEDYFCDICFEIVLPAELFTTVSGSVASGLDALEPVYVDIYDEEGTLINFAILTGKEAAYELLIFPQTSYTVSVSKEGHVSRTYTLDVAEDSATLELQICPVGDTSGDGKLNMGDISRIYSHIRSTKLLTDDYALDCADVTGDGKLNVGDTAELYSRIRGQ